MRLSSRLLVAATSAFTLGATACGGGATSGAPTGSGGAPATTATAAGPATSTGSKASTSGSPAGTGGAPGTGGAAGAGGGGAPGTGGAGATSGGGLFQAPEPWNTDVSAVAKDPASDAILADLQANGGWGDGDKLQIDFSITLLRADATTPTHVFSQNGSFWSPDCDSKVAFPVPANGAIEGEAGYTCTMGGDCHLLVVDPSQEKLFEMYSADSAGPASYSGGCVVVWDLAKAYPPNLRGDGCTSADAGGFPIAAMLFTADEVAAGHIDHAIRFILPNQRIRHEVYVHPGTHTTSPTAGGPNAPPYGVRLRLRADYPLAQLPSDGARTVAKGLQAYGMFLADGGNIALTAADDRFTTAKWADANVSVDSHALFGLAVSDFEVVELGTPIDGSNETCVRN